MDIKTLMAARQYVRDTAAGLGAVKGSPCTITSITEADDGIHIVFSWTGTDGTTATQTAIMPYVAVDKVAREAVDTLRDDMDAAIDTTVRSINGKTPDSKGNVALPLGVTGVPNTGSPNQTFVTDPSGVPVWEDRTHGGGRVTVTYDGTYDKTTQPGLSSSGIINGYYRYWKISDLVPSRAELFADNVEVVFSGNNSDLITDEKYSSTSWFGRYKSTNHSLPFPFPAENEDGGWPVIVVVEEPCWLSGVYDLSEPGIYVYTGKVGERQTISSLTYGWYKQLDPKYLPSDITIPSGGSLTLESGATVNDPDGLLGGGSGSAWDAVILLNGADRVTDGMDSDLFSFSHGSFDELLTMFNNHIMPKVCLRMYADWGDDGVTNDYLQCVQCGGDENGLNFYFHQLFQGDNVAFSLYVSSDGGFALNYYG